MSTHQTKLPVKNFSSQRGSLINPPDLVAIQTQSYDWFRKDGLKELFEEISPIKDYSGKDLELYFTDYYFDEPKLNEKQSGMKSVTYEAPLRAKVKLTDKKGDLMREQEVYLGDFPVMTERGTFLINGVERVVISQLIRSPGVYFSSSFYRGKKLFGAKIVPNRGTWLEFESDINGFIGVKIDRHRKVAATSLLRIFGLTNDEMTKIFGTNLEETFKKDSAKNSEDSYLEIYKRIRPGDLATADDAKKLIDAMFNQADRYDLSEVGRFKLNQRLQTKSKSRLLMKEDIIAIVKEVIRLNGDSKAEEDDIDHLGNRRVRAVGELLQNRLRIGFSRMRRNVQDRMSTAEVETVTPVQLINSRPLVSIVQEFFSSSQMSQFMGQTNPLDELEHKRRVTSLGPGGLTRERAGVEVRDVHGSYYGRICPIQTPEGQNIGLVNQFAGFSKLNEHGFLITPYVKVQNRKITKEILWLDAIEEEKYKIAVGNVSFDEKDRIIEDQVDSKIKGEAGRCSADEVELINVAPDQFLSIATSLIPFLEHDDANRALMASNMQRQAVPCIKPSAPYVGTGVEDVVARNSGHLVIAELDGVVTEVDAAHISIKGKDNKVKKYELNKFKMSNQYMSISQKPVVMKGDKVKDGDVLADGQSMDKGTLALGQNLVVAFMPFEGANYEDAIVLSEKVQRDDLFTSVHIEEFEVDVRDTKLGPEITTPDIPNVSEDKLKNLDEDGIIRIGAEVRGGDILV
ncbi:MAG TPA: DNA-directed RNA polymerase subunit beta, partial [Candidatus Paceibacterota bacterium]